MIRPIDIRLNAAHPELPLAEAVTFTGSPSTVLIRGVPPNCGRWAITAVFVAATYPDGSTTTRAAVQSANGVWVATLPATATSGRTANGLRVMADGIDENGAAVTGYILGVADFAVASLGVTPAPEPGETSWQMLYFDAVPGTLRKGDVTKIDGALKLYNGTAWEAFAGDIPAPSTATPAMDGTGAAGTSAAFARGDHVHPTDTSRVPTSRKVNGKALSSDVTLTGEDIAVSGTDATKIDAALAGKASTADATLTPRYADEWIVHPVYPEGYTSYTGPKFSHSIGWTIDYHGDSSRPPMAEIASEPLINALSLSFPSGTTATRQSTDHTLIGYALGSQTNKPLASEAEAEALRTGKQDALTAQQLANIAAVSSAFAFDATRSYAAGDPVVYNGTLYTFTAAHTGAWTGSDVSAVDIIARLADKLDKGGDTMTGSLHMGDNYLKWRDGNLIYWLSPKGLYIWNDGDDETHAPNYIIAFPLASGTLALTSAIPYALVTKTIDNGAVTLDDRASNAVTVSATLSPNTLTINFPTSPTGKLRDFAMRLNIAAGVTAPEIAWPQGVTLENNGGEVPEIADGGTGGSSTILYFSESENNGTTAKFTVKGETLVAITPQA